MNRMLEVEDLAFQMQLQDAVSGNFSLILRIHSFSTNSSSRTFLYQFILLQGFSDTSLTVGEAAAVLRNFERRTGEVLKRSDLQEGRLTSKLAPEDYNLRDQVSTNFTPFPNQLVQSLYLSNCRNPMM